MEKARKWILTYVLWKEYDAIDTLISAEWYLFWTSVLQDCERNWLKKKAFIRKGKRH